MSDRHRTGHVAGNGTRPGQGGNGLGKPVQVESGAGVYRKGAAVTDPLAGRAQLERTC